jgi:phenylpropionate dioxygenase-like ring-hydroxylating dioxygenase large terminal subunit
MYSHGWFQIAFDSDVTSDVSATSIGPRKLVIVRTPEGVRVADAICPHRGANLAFGGLYRQGALLCPFHGHRIALGSVSAPQYCVREYKTASLGKLLFVQLSEHEDNGFARKMAVLSSETMLVPGFSLKVRAAPDIVIENAFDQTHFGPVHGIKVEGSFRMLPSQCGEFAVEGVFTLPPSNWQRTQTEEHAGRVDFVARAFSPGLVVSELTGPHPYTVITAATPCSDGSCIIRLSLGIPLPEAATPDRDSLIEFLLRRSRSGLDRDRVVWEHMSPGISPQYMDADETVVAFRHFCVRFTEENALESCESH